MQPSYVESNEIRRRGRAKKDRVEQLADNFAAALLLPRALLERKAGALENASTDDLRVVATHFGVSPSALAWRLFNLRLINADHCDALAACSGDSALGSQPRLYSRSFAALLARAFESGRLSPRRAAKLLDLNLDELEHLFLEHGVETPIEF
jgi:Zn-dependent peptidase ImmA (M78 family)